MDVGVERRWWLPAGQRLVFEDFEDGVVMFDAGEGATHLLNASAAETLAIVQEHPGLSTKELHRLLLERLGIAQELFSIAVLEDLLRHSKDLNLVATCSA